MFYKGKQNKNDKSLLKNVVHAKIKTQLYLYTIYKATKTSISFNKLNSLQLLLGRNKLECFSHKMKCM